MEPHVREELRRGIEAVVRAAMQGGQVVAQCGERDPSPLVSASRDLSAPPPPLTDLQVLALRVLVKDPEVMAFVLLTCLEDSGPQSEGALGKLLEQARTEERDRWAKAADWVAKEPNRGTEGHYAASRVASIIRGEISVPAQ